MTARMLTSGSVSCAAAIFAMLALALPAFAEPTGATDRSTAITGVTGPSGVSGAARKRSSSKAKTAKLKTFSLRAEGAYRYKGRGYVLPRTNLVIRGRVETVLGAEVKIRILKNGKLIKSENVVLDSAGSTSKFRYSWRAGKEGRYAIKLELTDEQKLLAGAGKGTTVSVVRTNIRPGSRGVAVRLFQNRLRSLSYVAPLNGRFDAGTGRAFIAFRKVNGMSRRAAAGSSVARKLAAGTGGFRLRYPGAGRHIEVSTSKQIMVMADKGKVTRIYHVSTGKSSTPTIRGTYRVYRKDPTTNAKGMVKSSYFIRGYAIHGFKDVPIFGASHGCVRVPIPNASSIFRWVRMGTRVDTYF
ncbi:MAG: L,D-transpeptidase family protein [Solirubrobacterales bacterium]|nr:L,D-transpeptidase family protein [Solirubrobacterales bacterium]